MSINATANVRMEEGYMRATIQYDDPAFKSEICKAIGVLEKELDIYPEVIHRRDSDKRGFATVEFSGDNYMCGRTCGEFIEGLFCKVGIKECIKD